MNLHVLQIFIEKNSFIIESEKTFVIYVMHFKKKTTKVYCHKILIKIRDVKIYKLSENEKRNLLKPIFEISNRIINNVSASVPFAHGENVYGN